MRDSLDSPSQEQCISHCETGRFLSCEAEAGRAYPVAALDFRASRFQTLVGVAAWILIVSSAVGGLDRPPANQRVYVTALDAQGAPVTDLQAADFSVQIDGVSQEVLSATHATTPASIVLLTDQLGLNPTYTPVEIRAAMSAFVRTIRGGGPAPVFSLLTFDGPIRVVTRFTSTPLVLDRAIDRLVGAAPDSVLLDAVVEAARVMHGAPTDRRIIFTILSAYRPDQSTERSDVAGERLRESGASLWAIEAVQDVIQGGNYASPPREVMLESGTRQSGGGRAIVTSRQALLPAVQGIAQYILGQYEVTYGPGGGNARSRLQVGVKRPAGRVLAPAWLSK